MLTAFKMMGTLFEPPAIGDQELNETATLLAGKLEQAGAARKNKRDYCFAFLYITKTFEVNEQKVLRQISASEENQSGIDAFSFDEDSGNLHLYQFKWSRDFRVFKEPFEKMIKHGLAVAFSSKGHMYEEDLYPHQGRTHPTFDRNYVEFMKDLVSFVAENKDKIKCVYVDFVFNGSAKNAEQSKLLESLCEDLESKNNLLDSYFGRPVDLVVRYISNVRHKVNSDTDIIPSTVYPVAETIDKTDDDSAAAVVEGSVAEFKPSNNKRRPYEMFIKDAVRTTDGSGNELVVLFMSLGTLYEMYSDLGEQFFQKNIRSGLEQNKATNAEIKKTLTQIIEGQESAGRFAFYHNGVALTAQNVELTDAIARLVEPRIVNGAQTVKILKEFADSYDNNSKSRKERAGDGNNKKKQQRPAGLEQLKTPARIMLNQIKVPTRIIKSDDPEFINKVTINNNRQNPIAPWNLRANDLIQLEFEDLFRQVGVYYERRENARQNLTDFELGELGIKREGNVRAIQPKKLAQTFLALQGRIEKMSDLGEIFQNEKHYRETFRDKYLSIDPRMMVLLYKVQYRLSSIIRKIKESRRTKFDYVQKGRNLIWALAIQGLLNDKEFENYVLSYGSSLSIEGRFTEILNHLASSQVRSILAAAFEKWDYEKQMEQGNYSFLKTASAFKSCMAAARWSGWEKKSLG